MPINLTTGLPGAGKTLWTIDTVKNRSESEGRKVYYYNIRDLKLPWTELSEDEVKNWFKLDHGSIIVIDECQDIFVPWHNKKTERPEYFSMLNKHRHMGFDLYLITQQQMLIDSGVRRLVNDHYDIKRTVGKEKATVKHYVGVYNEKDNKRSENTIWSHPKDVYALYNSAEIHTIKRRIPRSVYYFGGSIIALLGLGLFAFQTVASLGSEDENEELVESISSDPVPQVAPDPEPTRSKNYGIIKAGAFGGTSARYVGQFVNYHLFDIDHTQLTKIDLERLGYTVQIINNCLAVISGVMVSCHYTQQQNSGSQAQPKAARSAASKPIQDYL